MMKNRKKAVHSGIELLEAEIEKFMTSLNLSDTIRMQFLEQSARYLGVYVENTPVSLLDARILS